MTFSLATYRENGETRLGVLVQHRQTHQDGNGPPPPPAADLLAPPELKRWPTMLDLLGAWPEAQELLAGLELADAPRAESAELLTPVSYPRKVLCAGVNYRKHIREMGGGCRATTGSRSSSSSRRRRP
ncbi:MAG: hypothetical protein WAL16_05175 [Streptosporangiaceae bacterium]